MKIGIAILIFISSPSWAQACATDSLKSLAGEFTGIASIVTANGDKFKFRRPKALAPTTLRNESVFKLNASTPCSAFEVKIDYLNPQVVAGITGERVARQVQYTGVLDEGGDFTLSFNGKKKGRLQVINEQTFFAEFVAPDPLNPQELLYCKEFISLSTSQQEIVRTIQCFDVEGQSLNQYRLVKEKRKARR